MDKQTVQSSCRSPSSLYHDTDTMQFQSACYVDVDSFPVWLTWKIFNCFSTHAIKGTNIHVSLKAPCTPFGEEYTCLHQQHYQFHQVNFHRVHRRLLDFLQRHQAHLLEEVHFHQQLSHLANFPPFSWKRPTSFGEVTSASTTKSSSSVELQSLSTKTPSTPFAGGVSSSAPFPPFYSWKRPTPFGGGESKPSGNDHSDKTKERNTINIWKK